MKVSARNGASSVKNKNGNNSPQQPDPGKCSFQLERRRSKIHRWGVFALERIPARRRVIEYTGEIIDAEEMNRRSGKKLLYLFAMSDDRIVDGAVGGSGAEFINHSCNGNMRSSVNGGRIWLSSVRAIEKGEELTYDYNIDEEFDVACECGEETCRGGLGK